VFFLLNQVFWPVYNFHIFNGPKALITSNIHALFLLQYPELI
jgi:hypothetical protein